VTFCRRHDGVLSERSVPAHRRHASPGAGSRRRCGAGRRRGAAGLCDRLDATAARPGGDRRLAAHGGAHVFPRPAARGRAASAPRTGVWLDRGVCAGPDRRTARAAAGDRRGGALPRRALQHGRVAALLRGAVADRDRGAAGRTGEDDQDPARAGAADAPQQARCAARWARRLARGDRAVRAVAAGERVRQGGRGWCGWAAVGQTAHDGGRGGVGARGRSLVVAIGAGASCAVSSPTRRSNCNRGSP